jgi:hypothetical protein
MLASQIPARIPLPFANGGTKNTIPTASQIGITPGAASLTDGFPPLTFTPLAAGGVPPAGADFNGILNAITAVQQWQSAGGSFTFNTAFSTSIGGYPKGATLMSTSGDTNWLSTADNNTTDPDSVAAANWVALDACGIGAVMGLTNANVTLTPAQYGKPIITLAGTLTGNVQMIFPVNQPLCTVINNTIGAFTVTCKTAAGTGSPVAQGSFQVIYGDGTNIAPVGYATQVGLQQNGYCIATAGGTSDAITGTYTPTISLLTNGMTLYFRAAYANATTTPTFKADGMAIKTVVKGNNLPLAVGDIAGAGHWIELQYDLTLGVWVLLNPATGVLALGSGQTWQIPAGRSSATTYFNTTKRPIVVMNQVTGNVSAANSVMLVIDGITVGYSYQPAVAGLQEAATVMGIVPPGSSYSITFVGATGVWSELR